MNSSLTEIRAHRQAVEHYYISTVQSPGILLVEDSDEDFFFFRRALSKADVQCEYVRVANGVEARSFLKANGHRPILVFLDLKLPLVNGFELMEWLRIQPFFNHIRVVILTGSESAKDMERARSLGVADYLVKPISSEILKLRIPGARAKGSAAETPPP
jgi:DNA-binding response OmpR family regulator